MYLTVVFRGIFWLGIIITLASFMVDLSIFPAVIGLGILCICYALYEQHRLKLLQKQPIMQQPLAQPVQQPQTQQPAQPIKPQTPPVITKRLRLPAHASPQAKPQEKHPSFFSKMKHLFKKEEKKTEAEIKHDFLSHTPQFEKIKHLFQEDIKPTKPPTTPQTPPKSIKQLIAKRFSKTPMKPSPQSFDWEEDEHYVPTGAGSIKPDVDDRYHVSDVKDTRYEQKPREQFAVPHMGPIEKIPASPQEAENVQSNIPHLGPIEKIPGKPTESVEIPKRAIPPLGPIEKIPGAPQQEEEPHKTVNVTPSLGPIEKIPGASKTEETKTQKVIPHPKEGIKQIVKPGEEQAKEEAKEEDLVKLRKYIKDSLRSHYPPERIKAAAIKAGWPKELVDEAFKERGKKKKKKKILFFLGVIIVLLITLFILNSMDLLLLDYLMESLQYASLKFYVGASIVIVIIIILISLKMKKALKTKKVKVKKELAEHVKDIQSKLQLKKQGYETDFDRLYGLLKEKKKLTVSEVAQGFGVKKAKAEEWGKILKEQGLIELYYPAVGEPELRWKK